MGLVKPRLSFGTDDPVKSDAREKTVVQMYRRATSRQTLAHNYYGLSGPLYTPEGGLQEKCELKEYERLGLLQPHQYHGIENIEEHHAKNLAALTRAYKDVHDRPTMHKGDIIQVLDRLRGEGLLKPSLVNLDSQYEPERARRLLGRVMDILTSVDAEDSPIVLVLNIILKSPYKDGFRTWDQAFPILHSDALFTKNWPHGWDIVHHGDDNAFIYWRGPIKDPHLVKSTIMGTIVLRRHGKAVSEFRVDI